MNKHLFGSGRLLNMTRGHPWYGDFQVVEDEETQKKETDTEEIGDNLEKLLHNHTKETIFPLKKGERLAAGGNKNKAIDKMFWKAKKGTQLKTKNGKELEKQTVHGKELEKNIAEKKWPAVIMKIYEDTITEVTEIINTDTDKEEQPEVEEKEEENNGNVEMGGDSPDSKRRKKDRDPEANWIEDAWESLQETLVDLVINNNIETGGEGENETTADIILETRSQSDAEHIRLFQAAKEWDEWDQSWKICGPEEKDASLVLKLYETQQQVSKLTMQMGQVIQYMQAAATKSTPSSG